MSVDLQSAKPEEGEQAFVYRALCTSAVASLVFGVLGVSAVLAWICLLFPIAGLALGIVAWRRIRSRPDELTGLNLAKGGLALSALFFVVGPAVLLYQRAMEVPDGYARISYEELQPHPNVPGMVIPPEAIALEGKRVFIKGFMFPGTAKDGIKTFLLVRDKGDCCFGGNPKLTDRILVTMADPLRMNYDTHLRNLAGVFHVKPGAAVDAGGGVYYQLEADYKR